MKFRRIAVAVVAAGALSMAGMGVAQAAPVNDTPTAQGDTFFFGYKTLEECMASGAEKTENGKLGGFQCYPEDDGTQTLEINWP